MTAIEHKFYTSNTLDSFTTQRTYFDVEEEHEGTWTTVYRCDTFYKASELKYMLVKNMTGMYRIVRNEVTEKRTVIS
jgi:hypothetical protein